MRYINRLFTYLLTYLLTMPYTKVASLKCTRHSMGSQWRFWSNAVDESGEVYGRLPEDYIFSEIM